MKCKVDKSTLTGVISCPPNKSYSHRAIFLAALANGKSTLRNVLLSRDTLATVNACKAFGAKIEINNSTVTIQNNGEVTLQTREIDASNSGTTIRISTAIASLSDKKTTETYAFKKGEMFAVEKNIVHSLDFRKDTTMIVMYDNGVELPDGTKDIIAE